jgi:beta-glucosidase
MKKTTILTCLTAFALISTQCTKSKSTFTQPVLGTKKVQIIKEGKYEFKDLNKNNKLDPYEDWRLSESERIDNLVSLMTLEEKVGLMFHPNIAVTEDGKIRYDLTDEEKKASETASESYAGPIGPGGQNQQGRGGPAGWGAMLPGQTRQTATAKNYLLDKNFRSILNNGIAAPAVFAKWSNGMQEIAEGSRLGIPIMFSTDPRHGATLGAHVTGQQYFSQWPSKEGQFGIAASRDLNLVKEFGRTVAEEYRAVGLHMILGPQIDVTTDPRWMRDAGCFSEDADLTASMAGAFIDGAQGESVGADKILVHLKHWPGSGPHKGGQGQQLVYPGNNFEYHLKPWATGFSKGVIAVMGYYSGTPFDNGLGVNYSKYISTDVLRGKMNFQGVVCTDWGVIAGTGPLREDLKDLPIKDRYKMSIDAGVDQFGGETDTALVMELVKEGKITEARINMAAKRILKWHFSLGLFENPYVDEEAAGSIVRSEKNRKAGYDAQLKSIIMLKNDGTLPFKETAAKPKLYILGIDKDIALKYADIVDDPKNADYAILRVSTEKPGQQPFGGNSSEGGEVNIDFPQDTLKMIKGVKDTGVKTVIAINLAGSLVVLPKELMEISNADFMIFDVLDNALLDVIFGKHNPSGKLPFDIPSSMEAVRNQQEDVPFDTKDPIFKYGFGLSYK